MERAEFDLLVDRHLDGGLDLAGQDRLEAVLRGEPALRQRFWELARTHGQLAWVEQGRHVDLPADDAMQAERALRASSPQVVVPSARHRRLRPAASIWRRVAPALLAAGIAIAAGITWLASTAAPRLAVSDDAVVADLSGVRWQDGSGPLVGEAVGNRTLRIAAGLVQLRFASGATLIVHGPAQFTPRSARGGKLDSGRIVARVPEGAKGFTIESDLARVVDLGTEFGFSASAAAGQEVQVFDGLVQVFATHSPIDLPQALHRGEAVRVDTHGAIAAIPFSEPTYVRAMPAELASPTLAKGLLGWWKLDETSGIVIRDASGHGRDGTLLQANAEALQEAGMVGGALHFRGTAHIEIPHDDELTLTAMTLHAWVRPDEQQRLDAQIISKRGSYGLAMPRNDAMKFYFWDMDRVVDRPFTPGRWVNVCATFDGNLRRFYVDGVRIYANTSPTPPATREKLRIGGLYGNLDTTFHGAIDEVRLYDRALSDDEVRLLHLQATPTRDPMTRDETRMTTTRTRHLTATLLLLAAGCTAQAADEATFSPEDVKFFETQVKPILDDNCLKCHGGEKTKADFKVTSRGALLRGGETGVAVTLDKPEASLLLKMVNYADDDHQMPPKQKLPAEKISIITEWVKKGLPWTPGAEEAVVVKKPLINEESRNFWAYKKPVRPATPKVGNAAWVKNPIDAFILADLDRNGLKAAPPASAETLIRRACYDLTGLPPTAEEVAAFAASKDPKAYDQLIEKLLASPHYGEKWGRHWLDVVGYADTNGYERDGNKPHVWRYRDYVVKAFNQDKPYDRFVTEQLAGDELADKDADSVTATGFYRLGLWDDEPADRELAKYDNLDRITSTVGGGLLGMAIGCARCHDHKRDPIAQDDYHRMVGFFNNIKHMNNGGPDIETKVSSSAAEKAAWDQRVGVLEQEVAAAEQAFKAKLPPDQRAAAEVAPGFRKLAFRQYKGHYDHLPEFDKLEVERKGEIADGMIDPGIAGRENDYGFVFEGELDVASAGSYTFRLDSDDGSRLTINGKQVLEMDGIRGLGGLQSATVALKAGKTKVRLDYFQAVGGRGLKMLWSGSAIGTRALVKGTEIEAGGAMDLSSQIDERGADVLGAATYASYRSARRELNHLRANPVGEYTALSITEHGGVADNWVLARGNPQSKTKKIDPGFPEVLGFAAPQLPNGVKGRRSVLAEWIVNPDNPLTARVMANRLWQHHFGRGIVGTSSDFGKLGELPTNQPLLDWLALEFIERKWSLKAMHRVIMTSSTYRMSSQDDPAALAKDAGNLHQWRYSMRRLTAEEIRDSILTVDGSLNLAVGGPAVFPPMPKEVLATSSQPHNAWGKSAPDDEVRRSLYIKVKRSLVHPLLSMHDFADTDQSCPVRFATTVPTQALTMLNSEFINQRAAAFADRLQREQPKSLDAQVSLALRLVTQREPKAAEIKRGTTFIGDLRTSEKLGAEDALTVFCLMALNLNEFVFLD